MNRLLSFNQSLLLLCFALICIGPTACSSVKNLDSNESLNGDKFNVPWPPPTEKFITDDQIFVAGNEYISKDGFVFDAPAPSNSVNLYSSGSNSYVIYCTAGYSEEIGIGSIRVEYMIQPDDGETVPTTAYFGLADFEYGGWRWFKGEPDTYAVPFIDADSKISETGRVYLIAVLDGGGSASIDQVVFDRVGNTDLEIPENLVATANVNEITVSWDPVDRATGYNIYRKAERDLDEWGKLNEEAFEDPFYVDTTVVKNAMYYYRVSAVNPLESGFSHGIDIFSPQTDLPLPQNVEITSNDEDSFSIAWDWEGTRPDQWQFLIKEVSDFDLFLPITVTQKPGALSQTFTFNDLVPGNTYYWRMCAKEDGLRGRMTDDEFGVTEGLWTWGPIEVVENGESPLIAKVVDNDLSIAFINEFAGYFARRDNGSWVAEKVVESMSNGATIDNYLDLTYGGGKYLMIGADIVPADVLASVGTLGNWEHFRIDGDGNSGPGHVRTGSYMRCSATNTSFVVTYHDEENFELDYQTSPIDVINWTPQTTMWPLNSGLSDYSLASDGVEHFMLWYEPNTELLELATYNEGAWDRQEVTGAGSEGFGKINDLTLGSDGMWYSPAYNSSSKSISFVSGTTPVWDRELMPGNDRMGEKANLAVWGDKMMAAFRNRDLNLWHFAIYDAGLWELNLVAVPGADIESLVLAALGDTPYIVYTDREDGKVKCAPGSPPE